MKTAVLILGNQLAPDRHALTEHPDADVIMLEADDICSTFTYHKHKLMLVLGAMRSYAQQLEESGRTVHYTQLASGSKFLKLLEEVVAKNSITKLVWMRPTDYLPNVRLEKLCKQLKLEHEVYDNQLFMLSEAEFNEWYDGKTKPLMENFYRWHRKRTQTLITDGSPEGGEWNYDSQNRRPLPKKGLIIPPLPKIEQTPILSELAEQIEQDYSDNPGTTANFWLPTTSSQAEAWLDRFITERLNNFGPYEDAMQPGQSFLFHSVLSPLLNIGLLSPQQVIDAALKAYQDGSAPINSVEGFVRQVMGWREYMFGLYRYTPELMTANYFGFTKELEDWWYTDEWQQQNLPAPLMSALETVHTYGYSHHIERLMVFGNWFLLNEYSPQSVYRWFMSMYVDAYEWVMVPNVQGMSQYADGGLVATKPYISGGNYLQKMGSFWGSIDEARNSEFNRLYWQFLYKHRDRLRSNPRMSIVLRQAERMQAKKLSSTG